MEIVSDRRWPLAARLDEVWTALARTDLYQRSWPWLRGFDACALETGDTWRCEVQAPLPYRVRFTIHLVDVVAPTLVVAEVSGDIAGPARIDLAPAAGSDGTVTDLRLRSRLAPARRSFATLAAVAGPLSTWAHHRLLDTGARQFADGLIRSRDRYGADERAKGA